MSAAYLSVIIALVSASCAALLVILRLAWKASGELRGITDDIRALRVDVDGLTSEHKETKAELIELRLDLAMNCGAVNVAQERRRA